MMQPVDDLYLHMVSGCAHEQRAHSGQCPLFLGVGSGHETTIGMANKMQHLQRSWALPNDSKHTYASFSAILTDTLHLRVAQMPRSPDLAIFVLTDDNNDDRQNRLHYPLRMRAG